MKHESTGPDELREVVSDWARRQPVSSEALCPDAEILAAFADRSLSDGMRATITSHLASCPSCQLALAAMARMESLAVEEDAQSAAPVAAGRWWRWLVPAVTAASAILVWVVVYQPAVQENLREEALSTRASLPDAAATSPAASPADTPSTPGAPSASDAPVVPAGVPPTVASPAKDAPRSPAVPVAEPQASPNVGSRAERPGAAVGAERTPPAGTSATADKRAPQDLQIASAVPPAAETHAPTPPPAAAKPESTERSRDTSVAGSSPRPQQAFMTEADRAAGRADAAAKLAAAPVPQRMPAARYFEVLAPDGQTGWRVTPNGVSVTRDGGRTWRVEAALKDHYFRAGSATADGSCWFVGEAGLIMRFTANSGWQVVTRPAAIDIVSVGALTATNAVVETEGGIRYVTTDGGQTWSVNP